MENIGKKLKLLREEYDIKQIELAKAINCSSSTLSRIENGYRLPTPALLGKILNYYKHIARWSEQEYQVILREFQEKLSRITTYFPIEKTPNLESDIDLYIGFIGKYYLYEFSSTGRDYFRVIEVEIEKAENRFFVQAHDSRFSYKGSLSISEQNLYFYLEGISHFEKVLWVFQNPIHRQISRLWGIEGAISVIHEPMARVCLLSDALLNQEVVRSEFEIKGYNFKNSTLRIEWDSDIFLANAKEKVEYPT